MITKKTKYAFKALLVLVEEFGKGPILIQKIADRSEVPKKFLEAILLQLNKNGLLGSKKGKGGGYYLDRDPETINMAMIYRIVEGPIAPTPCVSLNFYRPCSDCKNEATCKLKKAMVPVRDANIQVLEGISLAKIYNWK
jgi:Rrf2 family protein